jgi:hypothetical protein
VLPGGVTVGFSAVGVQDAEVRNPQRKHLRLHHTAAHGAEACRQGGRAGGRGAVPCCPRPCAPVGSAVQRDRARVAIPIGYPLSLSHNEHPVQFANEATGKISSFGKQQQLITESTRTGMLYAETDDTLAYIGASLSSLAVPARVINDCVES